MDRRGFLRMLGLGAAAAVAAPIIKPKTFFSFFGTGEVWKPPPLAKPEWNVFFINFGDDKIMAMYPKEYARMIEHMINPPIVWDPYRQYVNG